MSSAPKSSKTKKSITSPSNDKKSDPKKQASWTPSHAHFNRGEEFIEVRQAFATDGGLTPFTTEPTPATSTLVTPSSSVPLSQGAQALIERNYEEALRRKQALHGCEQNTKTPRFSFPPSSSCQKQHTHPFLSDTV